MTTILKSSKGSHPMGFTLLEITVAIAIIGILATIAIPAYKQVAVRAKVASVLNDFRTFKTSILTFEMDNGYWPEDTASGTLPEELYGYITKSKFEATTAVGGNWEWDYESNGITAGISIANATVGEDIFVEIDEKLDDGVLDTGMVRGNGSGLTFVLVE